MKISTKGRYALRMMIDLAEHQGEGFVALKDIAGESRFSRRLSPGKGAKKLYGKGHSGTYGRESCAGCLSGHDTGWL